MFQKQMRLSFVVRWIGCCAVDRLWPLFVVVVVAVVVAAVVAAVVADVICCLPFGFSCLVVVFRALSLLCWALGGFW